MIMEEFRRIIDLVGSAVDAVGVLILIVGAVYATICFLFRKRESQDSPYRTYRKNMGKAILLGLEFLVAADIVRTVVVSPTIENLLALGLVVVVRTFLSFSLEVELEGRWPWQRITSNDDPLPPSAAL